MSGEERPYALVAELTYRCPLRCPYCSNPTNFAEHPDRLTAADWVRVLREAEELGVLQVNLTGGEPLLRDDLATIVEGAARADLYVNLITSGVPLERERLATLAAAGLDNVQVSIQDSHAEGSDHVAGRVSFDEKLQVARWVKELGLPLTLNFVLHRENIDHVDEIVTLAERLSADRLELANTQYLGFALSNRTALLPSREQLERARRAAALHKERLGAKMEILFVLPDYYSDFPKACMNGWGRRYIVVSPDGLALPCHLAHTLPGLSREAVLEKPLDAIWNGALFRTFRGEDWMQEPCRTCDRRTIDFGGCRCQAFHLTGDAAATDPACSLSPRHAEVQKAREEASIDRSLVPLRFRYRASQRSSR
ncbi:MAG TPA: pyrroloquinoline quinone biosynthesis protein PqqE [Polyangiaceae bacterium]|jgi:pyrroloquinoline quinone biosynthesis protein E